MRDGERVGAHRAQSDGRANGAADQQHLAAQSIDQTAGDVRAGDLHAGQHDGGAMRIDGGARVVENRRRIVDERKAAAELVQHAERDADEEAAPGGRSDWGRRKQNGSRRVMKKKKNTLLTQLRHMERLGVTAVATRRQRRLQACKVIGKPGGALLVLRGAGIAIESQRCLRLSRLAAAQQMLRRLRQKRERAEEEQRQRDEDVGHDAIRHVRTDAERGQNADVAVDQQQRAERAAYAAFLGGHFRVGVLNRINIKILYVADSLIVRYFGHKQRNANEETTARHSGAYSSHVQVPDIRAKQHGQPK